jgi:hypothetical protein
MAADSCTVLRVSSRGLNGGNISVLDSALILEVSPLLNSRPVPDPTSTTDVDCQPALASSCSWRAITCSAGTTNISSWASRASAILSSVSSFQLATRWLSKRGIADCFMPATAARSLCVIFRASRRSRNCSGTLFSRIARNHCRLNSGSLRRAAMRRSMEDNVANFDLRLHELRASTVCEFYYVLRCLSRFLLETHQHDDVGMIQRVDAPVLHSVVRRLKLK